MRRIFLSFAALALFAGVCGPAILGCGGGANSTGNPMSEPQPGLQKGIVHYINDHLGNAHLITDPQGNILREESRYPYGLDWRVDVSDVTTADYVYTGKEYDAETGFVYFGGRYYSPEMGRWITPDPLFIEKPKNALERPLSSNLYAYVQNNPMTFVDDNGLIEKSAFEFDQKIGTYSETTLVSNSTMESIFQKTIGGGVVVIGTMAAAASAGFAAPLLSEAVFSLSLTAYSAQSSLYQSAIEETGVMWSAAKTAALTATTFALTHPEETIAFGKGLLASFMGASDVTMPESKVSNAVAGYLGDEIGKILTEQLNQFFEERNDEK